jgi:hypothetical protein
MKKSLYEYLNVVYLEYNSPTNLETNVNNNLFNFLINFCKLWNQSNDYIDFKKSQKIVTKTLKDIYKIFINKETPSEELIESSIISFKDECINFLEIIIKNNQIEHIISSKDEEQLQQIINTLNDNQKISNKDVKFISFLLNNYSTSELIKLYNWEIRTKIIRKNNTFNKFAINFNNLVESGYLKKLETVEN